MAKDLPCLFWDILRHDIGGSVFFWSAIHNRLIIRGHKTDDRRAGPADRVDKRLLEMQAMIKEVKGQITAGSGRYAIVVSRYNEFITSKLLGGATDSLQRHGASDDQITVVWVPGACEITQAARKLAASGDYAAVICLGTVIRGQTTHYEAVCQQVVKGVGQINYDGQVPAIFGVLTCESIEQAVERAGTKMGNAGANAAATAMEMVGVMDQI
jgi:6,7-dimethyl-8-ribityllumazine synthase